MKNHQYFRIIVPAIAALFGIIAAGCNQKVPDVAVGLLPDSITLHGFSSTGVVTDAASAYRRFAQFNTGTLFLGKAGTTEAVSFVRFANIPDLKLPDSLGPLTEANIESATLSLQPLRYVLGDSAQNRLKITVVEALKFVSDTATADEITPDFFDAKQIAAIDAQIPLKDTMSRMEVPFDKAVVVKWLQRKMQFKNDSLTYGIAFRDAGSTVVRRFSGVATGNVSTAMTTMTVKYRAPGDTALKTMIWESGSDATFTYAPTGENGALTVHGSVALDGIATFSGLALPAGVSVQLAKLTLTLDPSRTVAGNFGIDSVIGAKFIDSSNSRNLSYFYTGFRVSGTQKYVFPLVNSAVEGMMRRGGKGTLALFPEIRNDLHQCNRLVFFGNAAADSASRPLLEIIYSTRPKLQP